MSLEQRLRPIDAIFRAERIGYAIIGAFAVAAWGEVRGTCYLDLLTEASGIARIAKALKRSGSVEVRTGDADAPITTVVRAWSGSGEDMILLKLLAGSPQNMAIRPAASYASREIDSHAPRWTSSVRRN